MSRILCSRRARPPMGSAVGSPTCLHEFFPLRQPSTNEMDSGELLTRWTVRIAVACYAFSLARRLSDPDRRPDTTAAALWGVGCAFYVVHVGCAFHFFHHGSHAAAVEHTALRSAEVVGFRFGGGIYFNYLFTAVWLGDASWMLARSDRYARRPRWYDLIVHGYMAFIVVNATVVFGPSPTRWIGAAAMVVLFVLWRRSRGRAGERRAEARD